MFAKIKKIVQSVKNEVTNDKKGFIQLKCLLSFYVDAQKFLKAVLYSMDDSLYPSYCENARSEIIKIFVKSKVVSKINDNASHLPCFK